MLKKEAIEWISKRAEMRGLKPVDMVDYYLKSFNPYQDNWVIDTLVKAEAAYHWVEDPEEYNAPSLTIGEFLELNKKRAHSEMMEAPDGWFKGLMEGSIWTLKDLMESPCLEGNEQEIDPPPSLDLVYHQFNNQFNFE